MTSVPVLAVAGHLGAGKTTLLNHLLRNSRGVRIGALVNDFGAVNIDAMLVAGQVDAMASLSNGCICCAVDAEEAGEMLAKLAAVKPRLDLIVVEASGVAEPAALARTIVTADDPRFHYAGLVLVVDGLQPELGHGLRVADLVVLNKASSCADLDGLLARIRADSPRVPVLPTDFANIDPELLIDPPRRGHRRPNCPSMSCCAKSTITITRSTRASSSAPTPRSTLVGSWSFCRTAPKGCTAPRVLSTSALSASWFSWSEAPCASRSGVRAAPSWC